MTQPTTKIADRLRDRGQSQAWLSRKLGIRRQSMAEMLNGSIACPRNRQAQIAIHLGVKASDYFDRETGMAISSES